MANQALITPATRPKGTIWHFTQSGAGTQSGKTEANALPLSAFATFYPHPGDVVAFHGTLTTALTIGSQHSGDATAPIHYVGNIGTAAYFNPGAGVTCFTISPSSEHIMLHDMEFGTCGIAIYGFQHYNGIKNIRISRIHVASASLVGIKFEESLVLSFAGSYAKATNVIVEDCIIDTAAQHGIMMALWCDKTCGIYRCTVHEAATGGNFWGIYAASGTKFDTTPTWSGSNPYNITTTSLGFTYPAYVTAKQFVVRDYTVASTSNKAHFTQGTYGALNNWEFAQQSAGGDIYIQLPAPDATLSNYYVYTSPFLPNGGIIKDCEVHNVSSNGGTTDGVGIGVDLLAGGWDIINCYTHDNEGRGFELAIASGCRLINCRSVNDGVRGYVVYNAGATLSEIIGCSSSGATSDAFYAFDSETDMLKISDSFAKFAGGYDYTILNTASILYANNLSYGCTSHNATACSELT